MKLNLIVAPDDMLDLRACYLAYWKAQQKTGLTEADETFYKETLDTLLNVHLAIMQPQSSVTVPLTPAEWRSLRDAVIDYFSMLRGLGLTVLVGKYECLLQKLDALTFAAFIVETIETEETPAVIS